MHSPLKFKVEDLKKIGKYRIILDILRTIFDLGGYEFLLISKLYLDIRRVLKRNKMTPSKNIKDTGGRFLALICPISTLNFNVSS